MFDEKAIQKIFDETYAEFIKKHKISCKLKFVDQKEFMSVAKLSKVVNKELQEGFPVIIGALVEHLKGEDIILLNVDTLNELSGGDKLFVKSLIIHEFYHILFKSKVKKDVLKEDLKSEERAKKAMKKEFPELDSYVV